MDGPDSHSKGAAKLDRGYIGHQAARMMQRAKAIQNQRQRQVEEKEGLLKNIEEIEPLIFQVLTHPKKQLVEAQDLAFSYGPRPLLQNLSFTLRQGARMAVRGPNGSGKSTLLALVQGQLRPAGGTLRTPEGLTISHIAQQTGAVCGTVRNFAAAQGVNLSLFLAILRKLNLEREAFERDMCRYSAGQKKKVLLAASLARPAHLYVWDEPLNYIDVHSREQIEAAILQCAPSMLFVEHDEAFIARVATEVLLLPGK